MHLKYLCFSDCQMDFDVSAVYEFLLLLLHERVLPISCHDYCVGCISDTDYVFPPFVALLADYNARDLRD